MFTSCINNHVYIVWVSAIHEDRVACPQLDKSSEVPRPMTTRNHPHCASQYPHHRVGTLSRSRVGLEVAIVLQSLCFQLDIHTSVVLCRWELALINSQPSSVRELIEGFVLDNSSDHQSIDHGPAAYFYTKVARLGVLLPANRPDLTGFANSTACYHQPFSLLQLPSKSAVFPSWRLAGNNIKLSWELLSRLPLLPLKPTRLDSAITYLTYTPAQARVKVFSDLRFLTPCPALH